MSNWKAVQATDYAKGFDTNTPLTGGLAKEFANSYDFCVRYVSRHGSKGRNDLTLAEVTEILDSGLALMIVQHVSPSGWTPSEQLGNIYGKRAAQYTQALNIPKQTCVWLDLEGISSHFYKHEHSVIETYCNSWYNQVAKAGYTPGIYIGSRSYLSSSELYHDLHFQHYWKSMSRVPAPQHRGYQMVQEVNPARRSRSHYGEYFEHGIWIDRDHIHHDNGLHGTQLPIWAVKG